MEGDELELFGRSVRHAADASRGLELDAALDDVGWPDALAEDQRVAVSILFESQGAANTNSSGLDRVLCHGLGIEPGEPAVILPVLRDDAVPGRVARGRCSVRGLATGALPERGHAVVVAEGEGATSAFAVPLAVLHLRQVAGIDPELGLVEVSGEFGLDTAEPLGPVGWGAGLALGHLALAHELVGTARTMLALARQHALDRVQFGRPIATFQAVRHRLADALVAVEAAATLVDAAWDDPAAHAAMAKSFAGRQARLVARHGQQVLAGIGFTTEHPFHRSVRRTVVLDQLLGSSTVLTRRLGAAVLASGDLPAALPL